MERETNAKSHFVWRHSIRFKILQFLVLMVSLFSIAIFVVLEIQGRKYIYQQAESLVSEQAYSLVTELGKKINYIEGIAHTMANLAVRLPNNEAMIKSLFPALLTEHGASLLMAGGGLWPEPYALDPDVERSSYFWGRNENNDLIFYDDYNQPDNGFHHEEWYVPTTYLKPGRAYWSQSYTDPYSGEPMVTCSVPYFRAGKLQGIVTVDVKLDGLNQLVSDKSVQFGGYAMVLDRNGRFLSYPFIEQVIKNNEAGKIEYISGKEFSQQEFSFASTYTRLEKLLEARRNAVRRDSLLFENALEIAQKSDQISRDAALLIMHDNIHQVSNPQILFQQEIASSHLFDEPSVLMALEMPKTQWAVLVVVPQSLLSSTVGHIKNNVIVIIILALLLSTFVGYLFLNKVLLQPLLRMKAELRSLDFDNRDKSDYLVENNDELGELVEAFNTRSRSLIDAKVTAETASKAKQRFMANMSHEIKMPMSGIISAAELLSERNNDVKSQGYVDLIKKSANSMLVVLNDILDYLKIESGHMELESIRFDLFEILDYVYTLLRPSVNPDLRVMFSLDYPEHLHRFYLGDQTRLQQVVLNLVSNALKFTDRGFVKISVSCPSSSEGYDDICIRIEDSGIGIPQDKLASIFEKFYQSDESITGRFGGTGLSLAISRSLIMLMGGELDVDSEVGRGTIFEIQLKLNRAMQHRPQGIVGSRDLALGKLVGLRVLLVEDNKINQVVAKQMMNLLQMTVSVAKDGLECLQMTKDNQYDVIFMDVQMPEMDGLTATKILRQEPGINRNTPIIALTANILESDVVNCEDAGMQGYISKPVSKQSIIDETVRVLRLEVPLEEVLLPLTKTHKS